MPEFPQLPIETYLKNCLKHGRQWLVLEGNDLHFDQNTAWALSSSLNALRVCRDQRQEIDATTGSIRQSHYRFHAIPNLLKEKAQLLELESGKPLSLVVHMTELRQELAAREIVLPDYERNCIELAMGRIVRASLSICEPPQERLRFYHLYICAAAAEGTGIDADRSLTRMGSYWDQATARLRFAQLAAELNGSIAPMDLLLIGQYRGTELQLDRSGRPFLNSGLVLESICNRPHVGRVVETYDPYIPMPSHLDFSLTWDAKSGLLECDEHLDPLYGDRPMQSLVDEHFQQMVDPRLLETARQQIALQEQSKVSRPRRQQEDKGDSNKLGL